MTRLYTINETAATEENKKWPQYLAVLSALMAMFCSGIHFGWPSPSLPKILSDEYPFNVTAEEASYITVMGPFGDIFGNVLSALMVDILGRKLSILLIGVPQVISTLMIYFSSHSQLLLYFARFIGGLAEGACFTILPIYICEVAEPKIRGILGGFLSLMMFGGALFVNLVGSYLSIYITALICFSLSLSFMVIFSQMPESPYFLLMKDKIEDARQALMKLRSRKDVEVELTLLMEDVKNQMSEKGTLCDLVTVQSNKMACIAVATMRILQQFSGLGAFMFYGQLLFTQVSDAIPHHWASILMVSLQIVTTIIAIAIVDVVGRRPLILISIGGCFTALFLNGTFFLLNDTSPIEVSFLDLIPLAGMQLFAIFFGLGLGSIVHFILGELFPANVKAKAMCVMNVIFSLSMLTSVKFYQYTSDHFSLAVPFLVFALFQLFGFIICWKYVPETANKTLDEIQQELRGNREKRNSN